MLGLTPGNLITHLRKLEDAGYLTSETTGNGRASRTSIALTRQGRAALDAYTTTRFGTCSAGCRPQRRRAVRRAVRLTRSARRVMADYAGAVCGG